MPVKIRLMRIGAKKRPQYRVVAIDERKKRTGNYLELLGTYNPLTEPKEIKLSQDKIDAWLKKGAQLSDGVLRIMGKAPQKPPRKPKKEKAAAPVEPVKSVESEKPAEESEVQSPESSEDVKAEEAPAVEEAPAEVIEEQVAEEVVETPSEPVEEKS